MAPGQRFWSGALLVSRLLVLVVVSIVAIVAIVAIVIVTVTSSFIITT